MDKAERDRLREMCEAATAGPWGIVGSVHVVTAVEEDNIRPRQRGQRACGDMFPSIARNCSPNDSEFIAAARSAVPALLDALEAAEASICESDAAVKLLTESISELQDALASSDSRVAELEQQVCDFQAITIGKDGDPDELQAAAEYAEEVRRSSTGKKAKALTYMQGWGCAAGCDFIPKGLEEDEDFLAGWRDGRAARRQASAEAEKKYITKFHVIRLCEGKDKSERDNATRTTEEIRRTTVEAIVRRLREEKLNFRSDGVVSGLLHATNVIEREFLTEKGGA